MAEEWAGVVSTTTKKYLKGAQDATLRNRKVLAMLNKRGRIKYGATGTKQEWRLQFKLPPVESYGDGAALNFSRVDKWRELENDWRGYKATDTMTTKEKLMNRGVERIIDRYASIMPDLVRTLEENFGTEFYIDGNAAGNENRLHGIESFCGAGTVVAADKIAAPSDTYGGRSTAVQADGGNWGTTAGATAPNASIATDWPDGAGTSEYDYMSPRLLNWSSSAWIDSSNDTWNKTAERVLRQAVLWTMLTGGKPGMTDLFLLAGNLYYDFLNLVSSMQRIIVDTNSEIRQLGFTDTINLDGVDVTTEFGVPYNTGYGFNFDQMQLDCLYDELFAQVGPEYDINSDSWKFAVGFFGNLRFNPKYFSKLFNYAT